VVRLPRPRLSLALIVVCALPATARADVGFGREMRALAAAHPGFVAVKAAPYRSTEGRPVRYLEITNDVGAADGKPVFFLMGAIHGDERAAGETGLDFAYDVVHQAAADPAVKALFDRVRLIDMPVVNPDGWAHGTRTSADGTDLNRNYPLGWGPSAERGPGPGSEPEVRDTMAIVESHQVVDLVSTHTGERAILYPPLDLRAGATPELNTGYRALALLLAGGTHAGDSAHDYETSGETIDWAYYATGAFAFTLELGPQPRDALWRALAWASRPAGHSVITGTAVPGATLRISKAFDLYTATVPPRAVPTRLESSMVVPASGRFRWDVNPSVRPTPPFRAGGEVEGPNGFLQESWTLTCTAPDGTRLGSRQVTVDRGQVATVSPCMPALSLGGTAMALAWRP
jgi:hypothetical protein